MKKLTSLTFVILLFISSFGMPTTAPYSFKFPVDCSIITYSAVSLGTGFLLQKNIQPLTEQEILQLEKKSIPRFDRFATNNYSSSLDQMGTTADMGLALTCIGSVGLLAIVQSNDGKTFWNNSLTYAGIYLETIAITYSTKILVKNIVKRERPFVYNENVPLSAKQDKDARRSFYSSHTAFAAANTFFAASVISDCCEKKWQSYATWGLATTLPICIGAMRIESGQHFLSDVVTGYVLGAACGYLVPRLHYTKEMDNATVFVSPTSIVVKL